MAAILVFMTFSFYWTSQVISNVVHVTISGTVATYYFLGTSDSTGKVTVPVSNPTAASLGRAMTTSFGPIAFGSLLVSLLETLRAMVNVAQQNAQRDDNALLAFCLMCVRVLLDIVDDLFRYFNRCECFGTFSDRAFAKILFEQRLQTLLVWSPSMENRSSSPRGRLGRWSNSVVWTRSSTMP